MSTYLINGSLTSISNSGTIKTSNTTSAPIPSGKTWGGTLEFASGAASSQILVAGTFNTVTINNSNGIATSGTTVNTTINTLNVSAGDITIAANDSVTLNTALTISSNRTVTINGLLLNSTTGSLTQSGNVVVNSVGVYQHNKNAGVIPTATWNSGSTCLITGTTTSLPTGFNQNFSNLTFNAPGITSGRNLAGSLTTVNGNLSVVNTGSGTIRLNYSADDIANPAYYTANIANISISGGTLAILGGSNGTATTNVNAVVNVSGNITLSGSGILDLNFINGNASSAATINLLGNINMSSSSKIQRTAATTATINFAKLSGTQTFSQTGTSTTSNTINWNVGTVSPSSSPTLQLLSDVTIGGAGTFAVNNGSSLDCQTFVLSNTSTAVFTLNSGTTLYSANTNSTGGVTGTGTNGSIQFAGTRNYNGTVVYNGNVAQTVGEANYNNLTIANSSGVSLGSSINITVNNILTLTSGNLTIGSNTLTLNGTPIAGTATNLSTTSSSSLVFGGSSTSVSIPSSVTALNSLTINNSNGVSLTSSPTISSNLTLTSGTLFLGSNTLTLNSTVTGSGSLRGSSTSNLTIGGTGALGTINFDQTTDGTTNVLNNVTVNRSSGTLSLGNKLVVINTYTPTAGTLTTGGFLHLRSTASNTALMAPGSSSGGYISGDVTVERYMSASSNRAYRLITPGVTTTTNIKANWQEGVNNTVVGTNVPSPTAGYGTHITGSGGNTNGFDVTQTNTASLYDWNQSTQDWSVMTNTNVNTLDAKKGYLLFIRGNRDDISTINTTTGSSNVTLRAKGSLAQGDQNFTGLASAGNFSLVTNPFAAPVSWTNVHASGANSNNFSPYINIWDPNVNTRGGFITIHTSLGTSGGVTNLTENIQSGQAFFVQTKTGVSGNPTLTIQESHKSSTNNLDVFRTGNQTEKLSIQLKYTANNIDRTADGVVAVFNNNYSSAVDDNDAEQIANWDEDVALLRNGKELSIEARPLADNNDTLFIQTNRLRTAQGTYRWEITPQNIQAVGMEAYLKDNFTNTTTPVSLTSNTVISFTVTSNAASTAANRFSIVFKNNAALPVTVTQLKAYQKNNDINVDWTTVQEQNIAAYEVEKSNDGQQFTKLSTVQAKGNNNNTTNNYTAVDVTPQAGNHYYRLKIL